MKGSALADTMAKQVMAECESNLNQAQSEANDILEEAKSQAIAQRETAMTETEKVVRQLDTRWEQMAHAEASRAELSIKKEAVEAVMESVNAEINRLVGSPEFTSILDALLSTLMTAVDGDAVVLGPEAHVSHIQSWLSSNGHGSMEVKASDELWDGVALEDPKHTYRISNTLTGRYARLDQQARKICMQNLFGSGGE
jgi:vacuolar-type H+-ATPase subunit E/Vma4